MYWHHGRLKRLRAQECKQYQKYVYRLRGRMAHLVERAVVNETYSCSKITVVCRIGTSDTSYMTKWIFKSMDVCHEWAHGSEQSSVASP